MTISGAAKLAGVAGWPIGHSLSPALHGYWIAEYGLDAAYVPLAIAPEGFADAFKALPKLGFRGLNVTLPHKEAAFRLVDARDDAAEATGAVNTIVFEGVRALGRNTDVFGFAESLREAGVASLASTAVVVLGAGGAARGVVAALFSLGASHVHLVNRTAEKAEALAAHFGARIIVHRWAALPKLLSTAGLLVNTTSLGMVGQPPLEIDLKPMRHGVVADIVYRPLETPLLAQASKQGLKAIDGLEMLIHQARPGFAAWFGVEPTLTASLRGHLVSILEGRR
ncbi:MAG: shikimate dehydrogenase [Alphaproteobacteria bacterium]|nr:shikimate dehydrogenase [Alphaproteobacteria bacterium]